MGTEILRTSEEVDRQFSELATAAGLSVEEYQQTVLDIVRLAAETELSKVVTIDELKAWVATEKGAAVLEQMVQSANCFAYIGKDIQRLINEKEYDKELMARTWDMVMLLLGHSPSDKPEQMLFFERTSRLAAKDLTQWAAANPHAVDLIASIESQFASLSDGAISDRSLLLTNLEKIRNEGLEMIRQVVASNLPSDNTSFSLEDHLYAEALREYAEQTRPTSPPAWLAEIQPTNPPTDGTNGLHRALGAWPGDESNEEINKILERVS